MEILGIGPLELLFIFLIVLIVLGPKDMVKAGNTIGRYLRKLMISPTWRTVQETSRHIRQLPYTLARQAGVEEFQKELNEATSLPQTPRIGGAVQNESGLSAWTTPPDPAPEEDLSNSNPAPPEEESLQDGL